MSDTNGWDFLFFVVAFSPIWGPIVAVCVIGIVAAFKGESE